MRHFISPLLLTVAIAFTTASAQWQPMTSGLQSSRSFCTAGSDLYVVTYPTGVRKSTNNGGTWNQVNTGLPLSGSSYFVRSVGYNGTWLFAGTHSGIYRSNNGGSSWENINGSLTASGSVYANKFFTFGNVTFAVFAGEISQGGGIWKTDNNGTLWAIGHSGMGSNATVNHLVQQGSTLYASTSTGLFTSVDNGLNWTAVPGANFGIRGLAVNGSRLIASTTFGMRYSDNGGANWTNGTGGPANPDRAEMAVQDGIIYVHGGNTGCFRSMDNGASWTLWNTGLSEIDQVSLEQFHVGPDRLYVCAIFDIYSVPSTGVGLAPIAREEVALFPTLFDDGFQLELPASAAGSSLLLMDATGRVLRRVHAMQGGINRIARQGLATGTYRCLLDMPGEKPAFVGTVVAQ